MKAAHACSACLHHIVELGHQVSQRRCMQTGRRGALIGGLLLLGVGGSYILFSPAFNLATNDQVRPAFNLAIRSAVLGGFASPEQEWLSLLGLTSRPTSC